MGASSPAPVNTEVRAGLQIHHDQQNYPASDEPHSAVPVMRTPSGGFGMRAVLREELSVADFAGIGAVFPHHDTSPAGRGGLARTSGLFAFVAAHWRTRKWQWSKMRSASTA